MGNIKNSGLLDSLLNKKAKGHTVPSIDDMVFLCYNLNHNMRRGLAHEDTQKRINDELSHKVLCLQNFGTKVEETLLLQHKTISDLTNRIQSLEDAIATLSTVKKEIMPPAATQKASALFKVGDLVKSLVSGRTGVIINTGKREGRWVVKWGGCDVSCNVSGDKLVLLPPATTKTTEEASEVIASELSSLGYGCSIVFHSGVTINLTAPQLQ